MDINTCFYIYRQHETEAVSQMKMSLDGINSRLNIQKKDH